ncbi:MAG: MCP four helix bundle domain-containing protein [Acidobacteriota bacterium]|nr:MCP four helix bundle domain-containing protein [Acidobacteriota bacterium]
MPIGRSPRNPRLLLFAGFGGLLLLMSLAALDGIRQIRSIESRSNAIRNSFLQRNRVLNEIRSDLYLSGTWIRDYLLEPDRGKARDQRASFGRTRRALVNDMGLYRSLLRAEERGPFENLERELASYWQVIDPVLRHEQGLPGDEGYVFLRDQIYSRRTIMIGIVDQISTLNEHELNTRILLITDLFAGFRIRIAITMLVALGMGLALALFSGRRILLYEREAADHLRDIEQARSELKELSTRLVEAQETERRSISRELHDEVGQSLSALLVTLSNMAAEMPDAGVSTHLAAARKLAESSLKCVRNMALLLRPSMLDDLGLIPAVQWQAREISRRTGIAIAVDSEGVPDTLPDEYRTAIYRVVQEALHNCEQHAAAKNARVTMRVHGSSLALSIQDDGKGFDTANVRGMGLVGMEERISNLNGTCNIESEPGKGTLVMVRLPLPA